MSRLILGLIAVVFSFTLLQGQVAALGNSFPDNVDSSSGANIMMANGESRYVRQTKGDLKVWFKNATGNSITISNGHFCSSNPSDYIESEDSASWGGLGNGAKITNFKVTNSGNATTKSGNKYNAGAGTCNNKITFSIGKITSKQENGFYMVKLDVDYAGPSGGGWSGIMNYFTISASGANTIIGISDDGKNTGHAATQEQVDTSPAYTNYYAKFGTTCSIDKNESATIVFYDLDNAGGSGAQPAGHPVKVRLKNTKTNNYVDFTGSSSGNFENSKTTWNPGKVDNGTQTVSFNAKPKEKYRLEVQNVYYNNTIQYSVPYSQVYAEECEEPSAKIVPKATVDGSSTDITRTLGQNIEFKNWADVSNIEYANKINNNESFFVKVNADNKTPNAGNVAKTSFKLKPEGNKPSGQNTYKFKPSAAGKYCRQTVISDLNKDIIKTPSGNDATVCATMIKGWNIDPTTAIDKTEVSAGGKATWTHKLKNVGGEDHPNKSSKWSVYQRVDGGTATTVKSPTNTPLIKEGNTYTVPGTFALNATTAHEGKTICQFVRVDPSAQGISSSADSDEKCVKVKGVDEMSVILQAYASGGGDSETLTNANFTGGVNVSNFPTAQDGGWGYYELASQVNATRATAQVSVNGTTASYSRTVYWCPTGYSGSPTSYSYYSCSRPRSQTTCPYGYSVTGTQCYRISTASAFYSGGSWQCPAGYGAFGVPAAGVTCLKIDYAPQTTTSWTEYTYPNSQYETNYFCAESSSWSGYITGGSPCRSYYVCPGGSSAGAGWAYSASSITCKSWYCQYGSAPYDSQIYMGATAPKCEYRCPSTGGARPYLAPNVKNTTGTGELRCFIQPRFELRCQWDTGALTVDTVGSNGNYCTTTSTTKPTEQIGTVVSATLSPLQPTGWQPSNPQPGLIFSKSTGSTRVVARWGWTLIPATTSSNVVGMPYVKVYGGDVRVGGGVGATSGTCTTNGSATIQTRNQGPSGYAGSGTQFAAMAPGFINQFVTGQYNDLATAPNPGSNPTRLAFANNAGGSGYGGGFGTAGPCYSYVEKLPDDADEFVGNTAINGRTVGAGQKVIQHVRGNAYISGDIVYSGSWTNAARIPLYQLVVEGNIYIDSSITQLDGVYAAIATNSSNGNIYTCSFVSGASAVVPSQTYLDGDNCKRQLVVNGALAAKKVHFLRDCGSLRWAAEASPEATQYTGGGDDQYCGDTNHAAEIINFTPEVWIRSSAGSGGNKYDAISSMPPIL